MSAASIEAPLAQAIERVRRNILRFGDRLLPFGDYFYLQSLAILSGSDLDFWGNAGLRSASE